MKFTNKQLIFLLVCLLVSSGRSESPQKEILSAYARMSVFFEQCNRDGIVRFMDDQFQTDLDWNKPILRYVLNQLFFNYHSLHLESDFIDISVDTAENFATVRWQGRWMASKDTSDKIVRDRFPCFGSPYIHPRSSWVQIHEWKKDDKGWKITKIYAKDNPVSGEKRKIEIKNLVDSFHEETGQLGLDFGRNILHSVDSGGILFLSGESPSLAVIYQKDILKERPDITVYDQGFWYGDLPELERMRQKGLRIEPLVRHRMELKMIGESNRPVYSIVERPFWMNHYLKDYRQVPFGNYPVGMIFAIITTDQDLPDARKQLSGLIDLDQYLSRATGYRERELLANYHFSLGRSWMNLGDQDKAYQEYEKAVSVGFDIEGLNYNTGQIMEKMYRDPTTAMRLYDREIRYNPWFSSVYPRLAQLQRDHQLRKEAMVSYEQALLFNPENPDALIYLAKTCKENGDYITARYYYDRYLESVPYDKMAHLELAGIYERLKQKRAALKHYLFYMEFSDSPRDPDYEKIKRKIEELESGLNTR